MSLFKDIYDVLKDLFNLARDTGNQVFADKIMDIQAKLFEFKENNELLNDKIRELQEQMRCHDVALEFEKNMIFYEQPCYSLKDDKVKRFFCVNCWNSNNNKVQLIDTGTRSLVCSNCKTRFDKPS